MMTYAGNQMKTVSDAVADSPRMMDIKNKTTEGRNEYTYSASGQKLKAVQKWNPNYSTTPVIGSTINTTALTQSQTTDYVGNIIYENNTLKRILVDGGYYESGNYYFYINDHLCNNRIVTDAAASVVQSTQYYPFGTSFADATGTSTQPYKYNGKELDARNGLNMYDYSARWKDDFRFTTVDPLAELHYDNSPYAYVLNNPLKYIDPTGCDTIYAYKDGTEFDRIKATGENVTIYGPSMDMVATASNSGSSSGYMSPYWGYASSFFSITGEVAAYRQNVRSQQMFNSYYHSINYYGSKYITNNGILWKGVDNSSLINKTMVSKLPYLSRYGTVAGKMGGLLNACDITSSLYSGYNAEDVGGQIYYTVEGALKSPSFIPGPEG
jgi:RHS repeat-associated protein